MDDRTYSKSREKSLERSSQDKKTHSSDKRSRDEHYSSSSDRHHGHREKRRNYGDERTSRYERGNGRSHRDRSRDRSRERSSWSSSRRSSKDRTPSKSQKERSYHRRDPVQKDDEPLPLGPKADTIVSQPTVDQPPTAPAAYYQPQPHDPQQAAATAAAWNSYYSTWTSADYANAYQASGYTAEQYQEYLQYYQSHDPHNFYGYYDPAYYQQQQAQPQPPPQEIPPPPPTTTTNPPPPPPSSNRAEVPPPPPPIQSLQISETPFAGQSGGVPESALNDVGYPFQTPEDPSALFEKIGQVGEGTYG